MRKKRTGLLPALVLALTLSACGAVSEPAGGQAPEETAAVLETCPAPAAEGPLTAASIQKDGHYTARDDVALYLSIYGRLPENYITEEEARALGWTGGSVEAVAPGCTLGGDVFEDVEALPFQTLDYFVCDVDGEGQEERGTKRLVYESDMNYIYYTEDGETFQLIYRKP